MFQISKGDLVSKTVFYNMGPCTNKGKLVSKAAFIALFFSSRFFLSHMAICIPIKFSIYMGEVGELNKRPIPNCRPSCMDDQKLITDLYQIRKTRMHFSQKLISDPGLIFGSKEYRQNQPK